MLYTDLKLRQCSPNMNDWKWTKRTFSPLGLGDCEFFNYRSLNLVSTEPRKTSDQPTLSRGGPLQKARPDTSSPRHPQIKRIYLHANIQFSARWRRTVAIAIVSVFHEAADPSSKSRVIAPSVSVHRDCPVPAITIIETPAINPRSRYTRSSALSAPRFMRNYKSLICWRSRPLERIIRSRVNFYDREGEGEKETKEKRWK